MTTYQERFMMDRYANIATDVGVKHRLPAAFMHVAALSMWLLSRDIGPLHDDHLKQMAAEWAKEWTNAKKQ